MNRFAFVGSTVAIGALTATPPANAQIATTPAEAQTPRRRFSQFFADDGMNFIFLILLGGASFGVGDAGTTLAMMDTVEDGNPASAFSALTMYGARAKAAAGVARSAGRRASARDLYLQASNYTFAATYFCDEMGAPERMLPTWQSSRAMLDEAFAIFHYPVEHVGIPYAGTTLAGYFIKPDTRNVKRPLFIMTNGSDGSVLDMWVQGGVSAIERGYNVLIYDGPGQGAALWLQHLAFRPDWEAVLTPVIDYALKRGDVDPKRLVQQGISQGGYWAPRATAFEHRLAANIADPGVVDLSTIWYNGLAPQAVALLTSGQKTIFDRAILNAPAKVRADYTVRARPFLMDSPFDVFTAVKKYTMDGLYDKITTPTLVLDPENEQFFPGQPKALYSALPVKKANLAFTIAEGADHHCEPAAPLLRSQRVFDWLDATLGL